MKEGKEVVEQYAELRDTLNTISNEEKAFEKGITTRNVAHSKHTGFKTVKK